MIDEERRARIGLACAASLRPLPTPTGEATSPAQRWAQLAVSRPAIDPARVQAEAAATGWRILVPGDAEWPQMPPGTPEGGQAPWALWVRGGGDLGRATRRSVAVLGARAATSYGEQVAAALARDLADLGWTVITSCGLGCDSRAFTAAMSGETPPVAVYAAGPDLRGFYHREPAPCGLLVSDAPPDSPGSRHRSLARQDLLCHLSSGVVLVESVLHSISYTTAYFARVRDRLLMAVPGPIISSASAGPHRLIASRRATLVDSAEGISACLTATTAPTDPTAEQPR